MRERERERDRDRDRDSQTDREREKDRDRDRQTEKDRQTDRQRQEGDGGGGGGGGGRHAERWGDIEAEERGIGLYTNIEKAAERERQSETLNTDKYRGTSKQVVRQTQRQRFQLYMTANDLTRYRTDWPANSMIYTSSHRKANEESGCPAYCGLLTVIDSSRHDLGRIVITNLPVFDVDDKQIPCPSSKRMKSSG